MSFLVKGLYISLSPSVIFALFFIVQTYNLEEASTGLHIFFSEAVKNTENTPLIESWHFEATKSMNFSCCCCCGYCFISTISGNHEGPESAFYFVPFRFLSSFQWKGEGSWNRRRHGEGGRQRERTQLCAGGTREALGRNLNRRRLLCRQEMRGRLVPGMGLNWMFQAQTRIRKRRPMCRC